GAGRGGGAGRLGLRGLAWAGGCARAGQAPVRGEVTPDGQPLQEGVIRFVPADGQTPTADAAIAAGRFTATVPPGDKRVEISAPKVLGKRKVYDTPDSPWVDEVAELLPQQYNARSELKMTVQRGTQEKRFEVKSK